MLTCSPGNIAVQPTEDDIDFSREFFWRAVLDDQLAEFLVKSTGLLPLYGIFVLLARTSW